MNLLRLLVDHAIHDYDEAWTARVVFIALTPVILAAAGILSLVDFLGGQERWR